MLKTFHYILEICALLHLKHISEEFGNFSTQ